MKVVRGIVLSPTDHSLTAPVSSPLFLLILARLSNLVLFSCIYLCVFNGSETKIKIYSLLAPFCLGALCNMSWSPVELFVLCVFV